MKISIVIEEPFGINVPESTVSSVTRRGTAPTTGPFMRRVFVSIGNVSLSRCNRNMQTCLPLS